jgi:AraC-like DNA-binding protein
LRWPILCIRQRKTRSRAVIKLIKKAVLPAATRHTTTSIHEYNHFDVVDFEGPPATVHINTLFHDSVDRYKAGNRLLTDSSGEPLLLQRCVTRISTDNLRDYAFRVFTHGGIEALEAPGFERRDAPLATIVALDMNQPVVIKHSAYRALTFFVPRCVVEATLPHADSLHGRVFEHACAPSRRLTEQAIAFALSLPEMSRLQAIVAFDISVQMILAAFGKQAMLCGTVRADSRNAMFGKARGFVHSNLHQPWLSPESVVAALKLPRHTLYRLFEHEGGLGCYIRNRRLREAADELVKHPQRQVIEIAYGLGFNSASDFTRAFRRSYGISPQNHRTMALNRLCGRPVVADAVLCPV